MSLDRLITLISVADLGWGLVAILICFSLHWHIHFIYLFLSLDRKVSSFISLTFYFILEYSWLTVIVSGGQQRHSAIYDTFLFLQIRFPWDFDWNPGRSLSPSPSSIVRDSYQLFFHNLSLVLDLPDGCIFKIRQTSLREENLVIVRVWRCLFSSLEFLFPDWTWCSACTWNVQVTPGKEMAQTVFYSPESVFSSYSLCSFGSHCFNCSLLSLNKYFLLPFSL